MLHELPVHIKSKHIYHGESFRAKKRRRRTSVGGGDFSISCHALLEKGLLILRYINSVESHDFENDIGLRVLQMRIKITLVQMFSITLLKCRLK